MLTCMFVYLHTHTLPKHQKVFYNQFIGINRYNSTNLDTTTYQFLFICIYLCRHQTYSLLQGVHRDTQRCWLICVLNIM